MLLDKLMHRYHVPRSISADFGEFDKQRLTIQLRVCNVLLLWTKKYNTEFLETNVESEYLVERLTIQLENVIGPDHPKLAKQILRNVSKLVIFLWDLNVRLSLIYLFSEMWL